MTGISISTLRRWNDIGWVVPERVEHYGKVTMGLYSEAQVEMLTMYPPYRKPGPPVKDEDEW